MPSADDRSAEAAFQCAFLAVSYFAGTREPALLAPFAAPNAAALGLAEELADADRNVRALALSRELGVVARSIEARRLA